MITLLETFSDLVFLSDIILLTSLFVTDKNTFNVNVKKRLILSLIISCLISILFGKNYFTVRSTPVKLLLFILNFSKYFLLSAFVYKTISLKLAVISTTIQFICSSVTSGILLLIPKEADNNINLYNTLLLLAIRIIIMLTVKTIVKNTRSDSLYIFIDFIPTYIYIFILFSFFLLSGIVQTINYNTLETGLKLSTIKIIIPILEICFTVIIISLMINVISKKYQNDINAALKKQITTQLYHYEQLEKKNIEIRRFKHDYINHMKCISSLAINQEWDDILNYLEKLSAAFPTSSFLFETGNYIADAILTEKQASAPDNVSIEFDGVISTDIDNVDLCIILSNALDNAVEACSLCGGNNIISVFSGFKHGYYVFKIENPTAEPEINDKITTTKSDKINHGFGLANIKRTVEKYDGSVKTKCENNIFTLNIVFADLSEN